MKTIKAGLVSLAALGAVAVTAPVFAAGHDTSMMGNKNQQMAQVKLIAPEQGNTIPGAGYAVEVQVTIPAAYAKKISVTPAFVTSASPYFKPGASHYFPGLVVTDTGTVSKVGGPDKNLAGLFQIIGVRWNLDGSEVIDADWYVLKPLFSNVGMPCIRAYVVQGTAPDVVPANPTNMDIGNMFHGMTLVSNVAKTDFYTQQGMGSGGMGSGGM